MAQVPRDMAQVPRELGTGATMATGEQRLRG